jgi:hypothetical protein
MTGTTVFSVGSERSYHVMELPGWLEEFADKRTREILRPLAPHSTRAAPL